MDVTRIFAVAVAFAAATAATSQIPVVGEINFYGLHRVTPERILGALKLKSGDPLPPSKGDMEDTISNVPGVVRARVEAVCCQGESAVLFMGVEERGAAHPAFRSDPSGAATLPDPIAELYTRFPASEPDLRDYAAGHLEVLREVVRTASAPEQRAMAAAMLAYVPAKPSVTSDLQYALQDPDESVRANAARSLGSLAESDSALQSKIAATWLVELLNSIVLSDRLESVKALLTLTESGNPAALQQLRERALPSLAEMARWNTPRYALTAYLLLGRVAGVPEKQVHDSWEKGDRETIIRKALGTLSAKPGVQ